MYKYLLVLSVILILFGIYAGDTGFAARTAAYGNFDVAGSQSYIGIMQPGIADYASRIIYGDVHLKPLYIILLLFSVMLALQFLYLGYDLIRRRITQWSVFVIARFGVLRVSGLCPIRRTEFGVLPVLNCQGCEMATGACPIGMVQYSLINGRFPYLVFGTLLLVGTIVGRAVCGWLCPFGFFLDTIGRILSVRKFRQKLEAVLPGNIRFVKFAVLLWLLMSFLWVVPLFCIYLCQAANVYGYLPYWATTGLQEFKTVIATGAMSFLLKFHLGSLLLLLLLIIILGGRWWCKYLCPLGAFYGLFNYIAPIKVVHNTELCNDCGKCKHDCPMDVNLKENKFADVTNCIQCGVCVKACKHGARKWENRLIKGVSAS